MSTPQLALTPQTRDDAIAAAVADVLAHGYSITRSLADADTLAGLMAESRAMWSEGQFRKAGVGRGRTWEVRPEIRTDFVHWIDPTNPTAPQAGWLALIEQLRLQINAAMFLGAFEYEGMLAVYPPGSFYRRHLDRFRDTPHRLVTVSLYLNDDWHDGTDADGGQLRLYLPRGGETTMPPDEPSADAPFVDVWPHAGTVVIFRSDLIWHEVLPSRRERHSLTGWLRRRS